MSSGDQIAQDLLQSSGIFAPAVIEDIQVKAASGLYRFRGWGTLRQRRWATFDDLTFLPCSLTRIPLEGYREKCSTKTRLGTRFARRPIELDIPVMITGMSWGALSYNAKVALARGARTVGSSNTTGDGGMLMAERENSRTLIYEVLPSRYGINIHHMRMADAIELTIGQGAKPGTGGLLLGSKISDVIAKQRDLPVGVDQRSGVAEGIDSLSIIHLEHHLDRLSSADLRCVLSSCPASPLIDCRSEPAALIHVPRPRS